MVALVANLNAYEPPESRYPSLIGLPVLKRLANGTDDSVSTPSEEVNGTSTTAIIICNAISILACLVALSLYLILSLNRKYRRLMKRTSLALAACMASSDLILHCGNLVGYGPLPSGFACGFVGGWMFATPSLVSIFYSCCIAFNSQLVFIFHRQPWAHILPYYILAPLTVTCIITFTALGTESFGFDQTWGYCWYSTQNVHSSLVLLRIIFTYSLPTLLGILYLIIATISISFAVFYKRSWLHNSDRFEPKASDENTNVAKSSPPPMASPAFRNLPSPEIHIYPPTPSSDSYHHGHILAEVFKENRAEPRVDADTQPSVHMRVEKKSHKNARKALVMRQLTARLIGYIVCPILCLLPGIILDLVTKVWPDLEVPTPLNALFDGLNGLIGLFNSSLMLSDPALLAVWDDLQMMVERRESCWTRKVLLGLKALFSARVIEEGLEARRVERKRQDTEDALSSNFGLGARTRIDDEEAGDEVNKLDYKNQDHTHRIRSASSYRQMPRRASATNMAGAARDDGQKPDRDLHDLEGADNQRLEVRVTVDVSRTSRISRVELMEDWLAGL